MPPAGTRSRRTGSGLPQWKPGPDASAYPVGPGVRGVWPDEQPAATGDFIHNPEQPVAGHPLSDPSPVHRNFFVTIFDSISVQQLTAGHHGSLLS